MTNPWHELRKQFGDAPVDKEQTKALAELASRPMIDFFTPIEELKPLDLAIVEGLKSHMEFFAIEKGGDVRWIN